jgi:hypothetical protein
MNEISPYRSHANPKARPARTTAAIAGVCLWLLAAGCAAAAPRLGAGTPAAPGHAGGAVSRLAAADAPGRQLGAAASTPFAVMLDHAFGSRPAVVVDMRTGRSTGRVPVPVAGSSFEWAAAEPSDHAFVLAGESQNLIYRFYRLRLGRLTGPGTCGDTSDDGPLAGEMGRCGYGPRMPLLVISPWARANFVDHTKTNQASILRFIESNWHLGRIDGSFDATSGTLTHMFNFSTAQGTNPAPLLDPSTGQP